MAAYNLCDIFLIPSRLEGLSLSTLEAMSCGKPVIASNCSSFPELIFDGKGGLLFGRDDVMDAVQKIRYLAGESELIKQMGQYNRKRTLEQFTLEQMTQQYLKIYQKLRK